MSKILEASCVAGVVSSEGKPVAGTVILSEGVGSSEGVLILEGGERFYISKTSPDLKTTIEKVASALGQIATALGLIDAKPTGGTGSAPVPLAADAIVAIGVAQTQLTALKEMLK